MTSKWAKRNRANDVVVVLNDRQPTKLQLADALADRLRERRIPCTSIQTSADLPQLIELRQPAILILDYLLGESMTALDLIEHFNANKSLTSTEIVLWTDEPSIRVAVDAIRAGARDFIEMNDGRHLSRVVSAIERLVTMRQNAPDQNALATTPAARVQPISLALRQCYQAGETMVKAGHRILVLLGEHGSGRTTLARQLHLQRPRSGTFTEVELDLWPHPISRIFGSDQNPNLPFLLSHSATVLIDHAEFDCGELITAAVARAPQIFGANGPLLCVGTSCEETARAWVRLGNAALLELPQFATLNDDIHALLADHLPEPSTALLEWVLARRWIGGFRELAVAIRELAASGATTFDEQISVLSRAKDRWERFAVPAPTAPSISQLRKALVATDGNIQLAAAQLGVGVPQVRTALNKRLTEISK